MVKIITSTEASLISHSLREAIEVLEAEGYEYEARDCQAALEVVVNLVDKPVEDVIE